MKTNLRIALACGVAICAVAQASAQTVPAAAGSTAPAAIPPSTDASTGDIIVTAQRRSENSQKTSLAVTVLTGGELTQRGVRDLQDLQNVSPSLSFADSGLLKFANIRGVGLNIQSPTVVSGVATYRDGLFAPSPLFFNEGVFDIASVEVLRGPQGTFVGQNSTGGAIIQKSQNPVLGQTSGNAELSGGNYDFVKFQGGVSLPLTQTLAVRFATNIEHRASFYDNIGPGGDKPGRVRTESGRMTVLWQPVSNFTAVWKTEANLGDNGGYPQSPIPGTQYSSFDPPAPFTLNYDRTDTRRKEFSLRTGLELNWTLADGIRLRSIGGYQYGYQNFKSDVDGSSAPATYLDQTIHDNVYSEEINIISPDAGRFKWVVGGSWVHQTAGISADFYSNVFPFGTIFPTQDTFVPLVDTKTSLGAFAQGTFQLTDNLSLDAGGRYSHDRQTQSGAIYLFPAPPLPGRLDASSPIYAGSQLTGKLALNWQVTPDNLLYGFVTNGFKAGGVNAPAGTYRPEKITDFEGGWKGTLFDRRLRLQVDGFYMDYRDLQLNVFNPASTQSATANAGKSTIYGFEMSGQLHIGHFSADGGLSYVHSKVGALTLVDTRKLPGGSSGGLGPQCPPGTPAGTPSAVCFDYGPYTFNVAGSRNPYSPELTINGAIRYAFQLPGGSTLTPQIDVSYLSRQTTSVFEAPVLDILAARTLVGVQLSYTRGDWTFTGYATNLTNETYRIGNDGNNTYYGAPRQFGGRIGVHF